MRSIEEMVCKLTGSQQIKENALKLAAKIKREINKQYPYIKCSIGIGPNTFISKVTSNMQKPDGCVVIEQHEIPHRLLALKLRDLNGIGRQMEARLAIMGLAQLNRSTQPIKVNYARLGVTLKVNVCMTNCVA